jgi:hypothetical protein
MTARGSSKIPLESLHFEADTQDITEILPGRDAMVLLILYGGKRATRNRKVTSNFDYSPST